MALIFLSLPGNPGGIRSDRCMRMEVAGNELLTQQCQDSLNRITLST